MKKFIACLVVLMMFVVAATASAGPIIDKVVKRGELIVGSSGDYPPLTAKTKDGKLIGIDIDIATIIANEMGVKLKVVQMPFNTLLAALKAGKVDMVLSCMTITSERNLKFAFVGPYFVSGQSILTTKETAMNVKDLKEINKTDFSLAVPLGTTSEAIAKMTLNQTKIEVAKNMDEAIQLLLTGKVKAVMSDVAACAVTVFRNQDKLVATPPLTFEPLGIAVRQGDPLLVNLLNNILMNAQGNGVLDDLREKWFQNSSWMKELP
jgi:polar amino acid transport system substrate-binding protein